MKYKNNKLKVYQVRDARANFSEIVNETGKERPSYLIKKRDEKKGVFIDIETAKKYLPEKYWKDQDGIDETGGERFARVAKENLDWIEERGEGKEKENISENIDKIVYDL